ncbi:MAG: hypothetical protein JXR55_04995 [Candidatus Fermentibacteraceae bacterium]|nr:hypothetical protein [Candidatus Fermentibacteraceae bacterium]
MSESMIERTRALLKEEEARQLIHKYYSAECFNSCWGLIDIDSRSAGQNEDMILLASASLWHWKQRDDCQPMNLSVAYWQMGRVNCLAGNVAMAEYWADRCVSTSEEGDLPPFYLGYAYEVMANVNILKAEPTVAGKYMKLAREQLAMVTDEESRGFLEADLEALQKKLDEQQ